LENQKKISFGILVLVQNIYIISRVFPKCFLCIFYSKHFVLLTYLSYSLEIYPLGSCILRRVVCDLSRSPRDCLWS